jgi:hypothetical protein
MPTVTFNLYDEFREGKYDGGAIDFETPGGNGIKAALLTATYSPNQNTDRFFGDIDTDEVSGTGYTAGGNLCDNGVVSLDGSGNVTVDVDDPATWTQNGSGFTDARVVVIYHDTGTAATSRLIGYGSFAGDQSSVDGDVTVQIGSGGLITSAR